MSKRYVDNAYNRSLGRVGMAHGTAVVSRSGGATCSRSSGYSGSGASSSSYYGGSSTSSSQRCYVDNAQNRSLGRVGMQHGTAVESRSGGGATSSTKGGGSSTSSGCYVDNAQNRSLGRVGMPYGTAVESRSGGGTRSSGGGGCYVDNAQNRSLGRVGMPYGTAVVSRSGGGTRSSGGGGGCYVDNAQNRSLGRVGMPYGTAVVSRSGEIHNTTRTGQVSTAAGADGVRRYVDNPHNRKLGRVGKPIGTHVEHKDGSVTISDVPATNARKKKSNRSELFNDYTIEDLIAMMMDVGLRNPDRMEYQTAVDVMEQELTEEDWRECGLEPVTDVSCLSDHAYGEIIPYSEMEITKKKPIGRGGFGVVYAGKWHGTPIAYKKLLYQNMSQKLFNSFTKEVSILAKLDHKCTIRMFGAVVEHGNIGIVMEYMHTSLDRALHWNTVKESFPESKKKSVVDQIASALEYLHGNRVQKIAHCDVKPANILLDRADNVKLTDFGISAVKNATETSQSTAAAPPGQGTPRYSAPEVLRGELLGMSELMQTDIYSLAVVVFEILSEEEPYLGLSARQLEAQVGRGTLRPTTEDVTFSRPVVDLLMRSWNGRADARPSAAEFREEWSKIRVLIAK